jgi:hypothetical protein
MILDRGTHFSLRPTSPASHRGRAGGKGFRRSQVGLTMLVATGLCGVLAAPSLAAASVPRAVVKSTTFAGYDAGVTGTVSTFSGLVSIPTVTCPATGSVTLQPGVLIHTSGNFFRFEESVDCAAGTAPPPAFFASIYLATGGDDIAAASFAVSAGDVVKMLLNITSGKATMTIIDAKAKERALASAPVTGTLTSVQVGTSVNGSTPTVVPRFTTISFIAVKVGTASLATLSVDKYEIYKGNELQVATSKRSTKGTFKNNFVHA